MLECFSVFDTAVKGFMPPFFCRARGEAIRQFSDAVNEKDSPFYRHVEDFTLYFLGSFDTLNGQCAMRDPEKVVTARDVVTAVA